MPSASVITSKPALRAGHANSIDRTPNKKAADHRSASLTALSLSKAKIGGSRCSVAT
jgi:hypothetical protein